MCCPYFNSADRRSFRLFSTRQGCIEWHCTVGAAGIARTAFALGWERQVLKIAHDFSDEIALKEQDDGRKRSNMLWLLQCIKENVFFLQRAETRFWIEASTAMSRRGIEFDTQRLIMPGRIRHGGLPLALMPRCMIA